MGTSKAAKDVAERRLPALPSQGEDIDGDDDGFLENPRPPSDDGAPEMVTVTDKVDKKESFMGAATSKALRPFVIISSSYLLFTITDGAIRMIVLLHAYNKAFSALEVAFMFTLYELAGVFTNLVGYFSSTQYIQVTGRITDHSHYRLLGFLEHDGESGLLSLLGWVYSCFPMDFCSAGKMIGPRNKPLST